ncbi:histidine phosphatase family protein [Candidatus Pacearchaeota archaeon]|nr:histidine phosphatase family protein [Candidatus Pacearchaeota archaeon]
MKKKKINEVYHIYIFRHGQTYYNKDGIFTGWKDIKLTPLGIKQAQKISKKLKNKQIDLAFQTKLSRSKDTLKQILKYHPECKKIITDNRMIERNYGKLNGLSHEEFIKKYSKKEYDRIHRGYNTAPPQGESFADVEKRVKPFIKDLIKLIKKQKINVAISAHGNSIRLFRKIIEDLSVEKTEKLVIPYDNYYGYKIKV